MTETRDPSQALARRWFQKAENDLLSVQNNLKAEQYASDTVCFHYWGWNRTVCVIALLVRR